MNCRYFIKSKVHGEISPSKGILSAANFKDEQKKMTLNGELSIIVIVFFQAESFVSVVIINHL